MEEYVIPALKFLLYAFVLSAILGILNSLIQSARGNLTGMIGGIIAGAVFVEYGNKTGAIISFAAAFIFFCGLLSRLLDKNKKKSGKPSRKRTYSGTAYWTEREFMSGERVFVCSHCGLAFDKGYAYCPNCDRKMTRVKYDPAWVDQIEEWDAMR